jgi:hypothetical protein
MDKNRYTILNFLLVGMNFTSCCYTHLNYEATCLFTSLWVIFLILHVINAVQNFRNRQYLLFLQIICIVLTMICISYRINLNISLNRILLPFLYYFHYLLPVLFFFIIIFSFYFGMFCLLF